MLDGESKRNGERRKQKVIKRFMVLCDSLIDLHCITSLIMIVVNACEIAWIV